MNDEQKFFIYDCLGVKRTRTICRQMLAGKSVRMTAAMLDAAVDKWEDEWGGASCDVRHLSDSTQKSCDRGVDGAMGGPSEDVSSRKEEQVNDIKSDIKRHRADLADRFELLAHDIRTASIYLRGDSRIGLDTCPTMGAVLLMNELWTQIKTLEEVVFHLEVEPTIELMLTPIRD